MQVILRSPDRSIARSPDAGGLIGIVDLGLYTFGALGPDPISGEDISASTRLQQLLDEAVTADDGGLDVFGVGEPHRPDFVVSAPAVVLAAIAARTRRIRLTSAVNVISSDDPVRVFQEFATLDLISGGRAEIMAGRGSFIESFPLFGYDLEDYDSLFASKLELLLQLRESAIVTWSGPHRASLDRAGVYPRPLQQPLPVWVAVGGTPASVVRIARLGVPMALAIIGGQPARFAPLVDLYRRTAAAAGHDAARLPVSINVHGYVADTSQRAADEYYPSHAAVMHRIGRERGWPPGTRADYDAGLGRHGHLLVGSPEQVAEKILDHHQIFTPQRYLIQMSVGPMAHAKLMRSIELFAARVAPIVRGALTAPEVPTAR
jgi:probable LLM family oxidoreductase